MDSQKKNHDIRVPDWVITPNWWFNILLPEAAPPTRLDENVRSGLLPSAWALNTTLGVSMSWSPVECWCLWLQRDVPYTFINFERDLLIWFDTFPKFERTYSTHFHTFPYVYIFRRVYLSLWELFGAKKKSALRGDHVTTLFQGPNHREALKRMIPNSWLFISWKIR